MAATRALLILALGGALPLAAQRVEDPYQPIRSLGLPPHFAAHGGIGLVGAFDHDPAAGARVYGGLRHDLIRPALGILGVAAEGYGGVVGTRLEAGARVYGTLRAFLFQAGVEFSSMKGWTPLFTAAIEDPVTRGGLLVPGGLLRLDWTPAAHRVGLGLTIPLFQPRAGRTRPIPTVLSPLPVPAGEAAPPLPDSSAWVLKALEASARWIDEMTTPFLESSLDTDREFRAELEAKMAFIGRTDSAYPEGHTYPAEVTRYHRLLRHLFRADTTGATLALARRVVLEEVVIPMNRQFGTLREPGVLDAFRWRADARYVADVAGLRPAPAGGPDAARAAFAGWLDVLGRVGDAARRRWRDSRLVWVPFQLALLPSEHDTQAEVDALLERLLGQAFLDGNDFTYLINEAFSPELIRSIHAARDYHVLWVHDFAGTAPDGLVDRVAARVVIDGYLAALTAAVRRFDERGAIPAYMILLDQWYFDFRHARWWMGLLADPMGADLRLPGEARDIEARIRAAQRELRDAVAASSRLQELARARGADWLRRYVKVHVSVTYPGDASFRRRIPAQGIPIRFADDYMRDHRKVAFWDLTESDVSRGGALFTGEGVGENYEGARWEDRTLLVHGAAALPLKQAARGLFLDHGFREAELPPPLLPDPPATQVATVADSVWFDWSTRLLQAGNATGFGPKHASALKAALYTLMPAGSRILAPDSQWSSFFWAGVLVGSALRGCHVFVIAPRTENAPYGEAFVQAVLTHDVLEGYLQLRQDLAPAFAASGGGLYVGLYGQEISTRSLRARYVGVIEGMRRPGFPRAAFPFGDETYRALGDTATLAALLAPAGDSVVMEPAAPRAPRLHLKSQLFASREGLERVLRDPGWFQVFAAYVAGRARELARDRREAAGGRMPPSLLAPVDSTLRRAPSGERARDVFYFLTGSQNQNDRSLILDGEIMCLIAGGNALASLIDFVAIAARSTWVETRAGLDSLIPRQPRDKVKLARSLRSLF